MLAERYDPFLVALSYVVALVGSYTALAMCARVTTASRRVRAPWLVGGAFAQATGIWGMHFTGMLALSLPVPIAYEVGLVILSFLIAFAGAITAQLLTQTLFLSPRALGAGGLAIGAGIAGLHYTDMAAMRMPARTHYAWSLVVASVAVGIVFGLSSLWIARRFQRDDPCRPLWKQWMGALVMGVAIVGQHYTGMAAADFEAVPEMRQSSSLIAIPQRQLPETVLMSTLAILGVALGGAGVDRRRGARVALSQRLLAAQEHERRRISSLLHDDVGQLLTALRLNLQRFPSEQQHVPIVADSLALLDEALSRVRALSLELRPSVLDDLGLAAAIGWYANRQAERAGYTLVIEENVGDRRFPEAIENASFRIVQQALTNIARHGQASLVRIVLRENARTLEVLVNDDGVGFDVADARRRAEAGESLGLLGMLELAALAGGTVAIVSASGTGSTVRVRLPLSAA
jgi:NO-binding membrane sensor protein with MHYT domain